jgi:hypothetical protein
MLRATSGTAFMFGLMLFSIGIAATTRAAGAVDQGDVGHTGIWYDPGTSGQGFDIVIGPSADAPSGRLMLGTWFTFAAAGSTPDATPAGQRWYTMQAEYDAAAAAIQFQIFQNTGGNFAAPPITQANQVGTGTLTFSSCTTASLDYAFVDGRTGRIPLTNLIPNVPCAEDPGASQSSAQLDATWYDPATSGQGVVIASALNDGPLFVGWFTYASPPLAPGDSGQRWFTAQGPFPTFFDAGWTGSLTIFESTGGTFNAPGPVTTVPVGTMNLTFSCCGTMSYEFDSGEFAGRSGTISLTRLGPFPTLGDTVDAH